MTFFKGAKGERHSTPPLCARRWPRSRVRVRKKATTLRGVANPDGVLPKPPKTGRLRRKQKCWPLSPSMRIATGVGGLGLGGVGGEGRGYAQLFPFTLERPCSYPSFLLTETCELSNQNLPMNYNHKQYFHSGRGGRGSGGASFFLCPIKRVEETKVPLNLPSR